MANKKLYQMDWSGGQTDGDQTQRTVKELLNVEIEEFGRIRTRDSFVWRQTAFPPGNNAYMSYSPIQTAHDGGGWLGFIVSNGIQLHEREGSTFSTSYTTLDTGLTNIDPNLSEIAVYGDKFFLSAVDSDGVPLGAFIVLGGNEGDRFAPPKQVVGTEFDGEVQLGTAGWKIHPLRMGVPDLVGSSLFVSAHPESPLDTKHYFMGNYAIGERYFDLVREVADKVSGTNTVGVYGVFTHMDNYFSILALNSTPERLGVYGLTADISIKVQYIYHGGQLSSLSDQVNFNKGDYSPEETLPDYDSDGFSFGIGVVLPNNIDPLIKGVNIYRRINESGNPDLAIDENYYLINTVWVDNEAIKEEESEYGNKEIATSFLGRVLTDTIEPTPLNSLNDFPPMTGIFGLTDHQFLPPIGRSYGVTGHQIRLSGNFWRTRGWVKAGSSHMVYCESHYGVSGQMRFGVVGGGFGMAGPPITDMYMDLTGIYCSTSFGSSSRIETTMMRGGVDAPLMLATENSLFVQCLLGYPLASDYDNISSNAVWSSRNMGLFADNIAGFKISAMTNYGLSWSETHSYVPEFPDGQIGSGIPLIMHRDTGEVAADTEESFNGVVSSDLINQKPRHMALAGGRFIGLNGYHDGDERPTRAWYSQFQKFGMFNKNSYMDYGARDDGVGTGLSAFKGTTLFHFSSATYIVDVSGGFDMSWRELGAYTNIGLLHSRAVVETPIGVFWGDRNDVYWFNGKSVENVSHIDGAKRTIRPTYRAMVVVGSDSIRFNYRSDLRQVWVSQGSDVMVLDVDKMAWHKHVISEMVSGESITNVIDIEDALIIITSDEFQSNTRSASSDIQMSPVNFDWGIEFSYDAGVPEVIKKAKRFYIDVDGDAKFTAVVTGDGGSRISQRVKKEDGMIRFSASVRGRSVSLDLKTVEGRRWRGTIESIGMSHKVKAIK